MVSSGKAGSIVRKYFSVCGVTIPEGMPSINEEEVPRSSRMTKATIRYTATPRTTPRGFLTIPDADGFIADLRLVQTCTLNGNPSQH